MGRAKGDPLAPAGGGEVADYPEEPHARQIANKSRKGFLWATLAFLAISMLGHWVFGWYAYKSEALSHGQPIEVAEYAIEMARDTMENWQSEFLQLMWQVAGLALFLYVGSPQSKEGQERVEEKIDYLMTQTAGGVAKGKEIDRRFSRD